MRASSLPSKSDASDANQWTSEYVARVGRSTTNVVRMRGITIDCEYCDHPMAGSAMPCTRALLFPSPRIVALTSAPSSSNAVKGFDANFTVDDARATACPRCSTTAAVIHPPSFLLAPSLGKCDGTPAVSHVAFSVSLVVATNTARAPDAFAARTRASIAPPCTTKNPNSAESSERSLARRAHAVVSSAASRVSSRASPGAAHDALPRAAFGARSTHASGTLNSSCVDVRAVASVASSSSSSSRRRRLARVPRNLLARPAVASPPARAPSRARARRRRPSRARSTRARARRAPARRRFRARKSRARRTVNDRARRRRPARRRRTRSRPRGAIARVTPRRTTRRTTRAIARGRASGGAATREALETRERRAREFKEL